MKIAILAAMDKEMALLESMLESAHATEAEGVKCLEGRIGNHDVVLARCGIGKVNAALGTLRVIRAHRPELVINSGVAGGAGGLGIGTLLVAGRVAYHDVWCGPGTSEGAADGYPLYFKPSARVLEVARRELGGIAGADFGLIATGDRFISRREEVEEIRCVLPEAVALDMESAAIAQTCASEGVEFAIVRVVSDTPGEGENIEQYKDFWTRAPQTTFSALRTILGNL